MHRIYKSNRRSSIILWVRAQTQKRTAWFMLRLCVSNSVIMDKLPNCSVPPFLIYKIGITIAHRASLVVQWLRVHLPMQGTWVRAPVWEDPTCHGAAGPREPRLLSLRVRSLCSATGEATAVRGPCTAKN